MARILRGEIYWADLNPTRGHEQAGVRPVVVISHDVFNNRSGTIIAMAITSQPQQAGFPLTHKLKGDREGQFSIRINKQWRICFEWLDGDAYSVEIADYH